MKPHASLAGRWREIPIVNETLCTGSAICVEICPTECLAMDGYLPWLPRPGDCISCELCVVVCPVQALTMEQEEHE